MPAANEPIGQNRSREALGDQDRIVAESREDLRENLRLPSHARHAVHLRLELSVSDRTLPKGLQGAGFPEIVDDPVADHPLRHDGLERRLGLRILLWPDAVAPEDFFDRALSGNPLFQSELASRAQTPSED